MAPENVREDSEISAVKECYICPSDRFVDDHHYDCKEGKLSPETVSLCRRCHRTYHDCGVEWFDDEYLEKAIEIENKRRVIWRLNHVGGILPELKREDIKRSDYWNKIHGIRKTTTTRKLSRETEETKQLGFAMIDNLIMEFTKCLEEK